MNRALPAWAQRTAGGLCLAVAALLLLTAVLAPLLGSEDILDIALLYLLATLLAAAIWGYVVGLTAAVIADLLVTFFFVEPLHTLTVEAPSNVVALLVFLAVAVVGASMLARLRREVTQSRASEAEANIMLELNQAIALAASPEAALRRLCAVVAQALGAEGCAIMRLSAEWEVAAATADAASAAPPDRDEQRLLFEALRGQRVVATGRSTARIHVPPLSFVPFPREAAERGALRITGTMTTPAQTDEARLLGAVAAEASTALHRARLATDAQRADDLQRADEFKTALLSSVSHDLRSPLTAIKAAVGSLRGQDVEWSAEDVAGFLETIENQADRLTAIVTDLLQISRLEGGPVHTAIEPIEVTALLDDAAQASTTATAGRPVVIDAPAALWLAGDYGLLMQVIANLLENAARYSPPGLPIRLGARRQGDHVRITVRDEGPGIPSEDLPHIFEKFYRGGRTQDSRGTGLGLSIVKAMVEVCGGSVDVRSSGRGTEFALALPAVAQPA